ncbi:thymidine phosphorylase [bacterium]|nr:thymidine phosphorylase [bacterium]
MELLSLIRAKRRGAELPAAEIHRLVTGIVEHSVADYQLSALLMAICYEGLSYNETLELTRAFIDSGVTLDWSHLPGPIVDKHSTGGVGDKVSLMLMPWLAAAGLTVPKMSGRSLGHTGGTIDKLESIPGFDVNLSGRQMEDVIKQVGCCIVAQGANLVPADKIVYTLRDATDTVDEMGLIAASVMSKKLAAGADCIVLDVKCGSGAFFTSLARARKFADIALRLGRDLGKPIGCVISNMEQPLGRTVGNAMEVLEARAALAGESPQPDLSALCATLGGVLLVTCNRGASYQEGQARMERARESGAALERFDAWIAAQGGDYARLEAARTKAEKELRLATVPALKDGVISDMDTRRIGEVARRLGAGRLTTADRIDPWAGILCRAKIGDSVVQGEPLAVLVRGPAAPPVPGELVREYQQAVAVSSYAVELPGIVLDVMPANRGLSIIGG